jgi:hypothetical protein
MDMLRDMLIWLGVDASGISNLKLLIGLFIGFVFLCVGGYGAYLLLLLAGRITTEQRHGAHRARTVTAQALIEAQKKEGEARIHKAQMDARAAQEESRLQEIKSGPDREVKRLKDEIADLRKRIKDKDDEAAKSAQALADMTAARNDIEGKYQIQETQIKHMRLEVDSLKTEYNAADDERVALKERLAAAEATAAAAVAEAQRREAALLDLAGIRAAVDALASQHGSTAPGAPALAAAPAPTPVIAPAAVPAPRPPSATWRAPAPTPSTAVAAPAPAAVLVPVASVPEGPSGVIPAAAPSVASTRPETDEAIRLDDMDLSMSGGSRVDSGIRDEAEDAPPSPI